MSTIEDHFDNTTVTDVVRDALDERAVVHAALVDRVSPDLVRKPGSGAGEIEMAADFEATPTGFEEYL